MSKCPLVKCLITNSVRFVCISEKVHEHGIIVPMFLVIPDFIDVCCLMLPELSGRLVGEAFYHGELECELRQTGKIQYRFRADSDREECMAMLEQMRRETTYPHSVCTDDCKKRG